MSSFNVNNNASASNILMNLAMVQNKISSSYSQLSSGNRINSAADDPAGYAISQQMGSQVNALNAATQNAQNGVSLIQTATGAMNQVEGILQTMNTLAVEASNGTQNTADLANLQQEMTALTTQIDTTASTTQFNGIQLLDGSAVALTLQIGFDGTTSSQLSFGISGISSGALGISTGTIGITTQAAAQSAITAIQTAITSLSGYQASVGSIQDRLGYTISNLQNTSENLVNANATISNTDMATAYTQFSQQQVVEQVGLAMLSQAQQQPGAILKLLS
jgi:flagellin